MTALNAESVQQYLIAQGWRSVTSRRPEIGVWRTADDGEELHVPLTRQLDGYDSALTRVAELLARFEKRQVDAVVRDLIRPRADTLRFSLVGDATRDGTADLVSGVNFIGGVRSALAAGACTAVRPQRFFGRMGFSEATRYLGQCRLGQTEVGSFVLTVETPLALGLALEASQPNFGRRASLALVQGVEQLVTRVRSHTEDSLVDADDTGRLVSANLCSAITEMAPDDESVDLQLASSWSPLLPHPKSPAIRIERELYERIEVLADRLRPAGEERLELIIATVSRLSGRPDGAGHVSGEVTLSPVFPTELRSVSVMLDAEQYLLAATAHTSNQYVRTAGVLRRVGRTRVLQVQGEFLRFDE